MRRFQLYRIKDITGISGTGVIAEGCEVFTDGPAFLYWIKTGTSGNYPCVLDQGEGNSIEEIHCYSVRGEPNAEIRWIDQEEEEYY